MLTTKEIKQWLLTIKRDEGLILKPYWDKTGAEAVGHVTIGYGRNLSRGISEGEAEFLAMQDLMWVTKELGTLVDTSKLNGPRKVALCNMYYQQGYPAFKAKKRFISLLNDGLFTLAAQNLRAQKKWVETVKSRAERIAFTVEHGKFHPEYGL